MSPNAPVTVIGLGPMGQAMVRALLAAGHSVTVWNRTASRAEDVLSEGAILAASPTEAVRASDLVILSLTDYQAMYDVLGNATYALAGRVVVNLSSDSPSRTREAAAWATGHGAELVVGGVMVPAPMIGTATASVYYSGAPGAVERHRDTIARLGEPRYLGEDHALAQLMYQANLDVFLTALSAVAHATALLETAELSASEVMPGLLEMVRSTPDLATAGQKEGEELWTHIDAGHHPGDLSTVTMMGATADHIVQASEEVGIDLTLPRAVQTHYRRAIADGHGHENWTRIIEGIRDPR
ncbi:MAG TPA: NAD(P)-binding domain-containing protein [Jiangellaceae bacterium]|nr:NAD(P)-binding domain-containing protein [Jiangellaceae bacterium]